MIKRTIKGLLHWLGYEIRNIKYQRPPRGYTLYRYVKNDGTFDYDRYRRVQIAGNHAKIDKVFATESNIRFLSTYIEKIIGQPRFGICHGSRRGKEQEWFRKYLGCEVIGTEISDSATEFPHTIQMDFHETKTQWVGAVDFIYSNAFDHSYDPEKSLDAWMSCLTSRGLCIIEHSRSHRARPAIELDPFGADLYLMPYLIAKWGKGHYGILEIIDAPEGSGNEEFSSFIIIQRYEATHPVNQEETPTATRR
jgi:hypothetical protein